MPDLKSFDESGMQFAWDATSLSNFMKCPRYYQYTNLLGWQPSHKSVHLIFGGLYASALEHYFKHLAAGLAPLDALDAIVDEALRETWHRETPDDEGEPWVSGHDKKTRETLIRTIIWYIDHFHLGLEKDTMEVITLDDGKPAVELSFAVELNDDYLWCGHIDRMVRYNGDAYVMDQKAQPLSTTVLGPNGWTPIGDLRVGDSIFGKNGELTTVTALHPKGVTPVYRVHFNDDTSVLCGEDHLWSVNTQFNDGWQTLSMQDLLHAPAWRKFHVPLVDPIQHDELEYPLSPYLLGVLLGDGYLNGNSIQLSSGKQWLIDNVRQHLPAGDRIRKSPSDNYVWTISGGNTLAAVKELGLKGKLSATKFIPPAYLFGSVEQRELLLAGLLDTDGSWNGKSRIYDSTSLSLTKRLCQLVRSLGGTARYRDRRDGCYRTSLRLPDLPTGVGKRYITGIVREGSDETMCIEVAAADHLYVTENYTVTHNTTGSGLTAYYFSSFALDVQMSGYTYGASVGFHLPIKGVVIDAAQILVGGTQYGRGFVTRSANQIKEWRHTAEYYIAEAKRAHESGYYPMNTNSCNNYGACAFKKVCERSPEHRENFLAADFERRPRWDPLERR